MPGVSTRLIHTRTSVSSNKGSRSDHVPHRVPLSTSIRDQYLRASAMNEYVQSFYLRYASFKSVEEPNKSEARLKSL